MFFLTLNKTDTCMSIPDIFDFPKSVTFMKDLAVAYQDNMSMKCIPTHVPLLYSKIGVYIGILFFTLKQIFGYSSEVLLRYIPTM